LFIPHQANIRIAQYVQGLLKLPEEKVFINILKLKTEINYMRPQEILKDIGLKEKM
jgi:hypothetical protein